MTDQIKQGAGNAAPNNETAPKRRKGRRGRLGCLLGLCFGLAGLAAAQLGNLWIAFDVFSQFTPQFMFMVVAFVIGLIMPRAKMLSAIVVLIGLLTAQSMWPYYASAHVKVLNTLAAGERELRVASFNTYIGNEKVDEVKAEVARLDADVVVLIELGPQKLVIFDQLKTQYPYVAQCSDVTHCNFGILSKYPLSSISDRMLWEGPPFMRASLGAEFGNLTIFAVHTTRFPHPRTQFTQVKALVDELETIVGPHIVMGDMNATPYSRVTATLAAQANLTRLTNLPTWPATIGLPQIAIDHIFVSDGIRPLESQSIGNSAGSDHFPIFMKLAIPVKP